MLKHCTNIRPTTATTRTTGIWHIPEPRTECLFQLRWDLCFTPASHHRFHRMGCHQLSQANDHFRPTKSFRPTRTTSIHATRTLHTTLIWKTLSDSIPSFLWKTPWSPSCQACSSPPGFRKFFSRVCECSQNHEFTLICGDSKLPPTSKK